MDASSPSVKRQQVIYHAGPSRLILEKSLVNCGSRAGHEAPTQVQYSVSKLATAMISLSLWYLPNLPDIDEFYRPTI
jgi:NAD(P)-dependent dehydrogenase (short-subunit alcohol dehydrogenase family)